MKLTYSFLPALLLVASQLGAAVPTEEDCSTKGGVLEFNMSPEEAFAAGIDPKAVRHCVDPSVISPNNKDHGVNVLEKRECWFGRTSGCGENKRCWTKCKDFTQAQNPLMALACWHLYPDLLVLGNKSSLVNFNDDIIKNCAQLTVGVERTDADGGHGIYWSLALSHLRFYGDPVIASTHTRKDVARLAIEDFFLIALEAVLSHWGSLAYDACLGANFFVLLGSHMQDEIQNNAHPRWLRALYIASKRLLAASGDDRKTCLAIVALGRRSGRSFLAESSFYPPMLLGLSDTYMQSRISRNPLQVNVEERKGGMLSVSVPNSSRVRIPDIGIGYSFQQRFSSTFNEYSKNALLLMDYPVCECFQHSTDQQPSGEYSPAFFTVLAGDPDGHALFVRAREARHGGKQLRHQLADHCRSAASEPMKDAESVIQQLKGDSIDSEVLGSYVLSLASGVAEFPTFNRDLSPRECLFQPFIESMNALALASDVFSTMPGTTCSLGILERPLRLAEWVPRSINLCKQKDWELSRPARFSCIAYFESGSYDLAPVIMKDVIAISARNSIYVSATLLGDPHEESSKDSIVCVVGNVGKTGMVMMVAPLNPRIRPTEVKKWIKVAHEPYDGLTEDCFTSTSLHLSFTEFEMPYDLGKRGSIDNDVHFVETIVSVYEKSEWVADLDVLLLFEPLLSGYQCVRRFKRSTHERGCYHPSPSWRALPYRLTSIDNWEELINAPNDLGQSHIAIIRANDNRLARLAAASVAVQMGLRTVVLPNSDFCWSCCCLRTWAWKDSTSEKQNETADPERTMLGKSAGPAYESPNSKRSTEEHPDPEWAGIKIHRESTSSDVESIWDSDDEHVDDNQAKQAENKLRHFEFIDSEDEYDSDSTAKSVHWFKESKDGYDAVPQVLIS
ncbi:hypothetical protein HJFPF1_02305 [Paramyrothecium foliicola]|nr:hypothetical protein HJFPF1_02305 [Paramyrothecium foliicola]